MDACGKEQTRSCIINNIQTFSPRQCSVVFRDLPPSSYDYIAKVQSNIPLQCEENVLNMSGTFVTAGMHISHYYLCISSVVAYTHINFLYALYN